MKKRKLKQYCRYCQYCQIDGMSGGPMCEKKQLLMSIAEAKRKNNCVDYITCEVDEPEYIDFFLETIYKPRYERQPKEDKSYKTLSLF